MDCFAALAETPANDSDATESALDRVALGLARHAAIGVEQPLAPGEQRVVALEQFLRADAACPAEGAEQDVVDVARRGAGEIGLLLQGQARRLQDLAERRDLGVGILDDLLERGAEALLAALAEVRLVDVTELVVDVEENDPDQLRIDDVVDPIVEERR